MNYANLNGIEFRGSYAFRVTVAVRAGRDYVIGSHTDCDIVIPGEEIHDRHARLTVTATEVRICPVEPANTSINGQQLTASQPLHDRDWLALENVQFQIKYFFDGVEPKTDTVSEARRTGAVATPEARLLGRSTHCDLSVQSPLLARFHARITTQAPGTAVLEDLNTSAGTWLNFQPVRGKATLHRNDTVTVAGYSYRFDGVRLVPDTPGRGLRIAARDLLTRTCGGRSGATAGPFNIVVAPGELVAIVSSPLREADAILETLGGARVAPGVDLRYDDQPAALALPALRSTLGRVSFTRHATQVLLPTRSLYYAARLRLAADTSAHELQARLLQVVQQTHPYRETGRGAEPTDKADPYLTLAIELLSEPRALFVEGIEQVAEPQAVLDFLRALSDSGITVLCSLSDPALASRCHLLAIAAAGQLVYFGPPENAAAYFGVTQTAQISAQLAAAAPEQWAASYRTSPYFETYVSKRQSPALHAPDRSLPAALPARRSWRHLGTVVQRQGEELLRQARRLQFWVLQAPLIGLLSALAGGLQRTQAASGSTLLLATIGAVWLGLMTAAGELHRTRQRSQREQDFGLSSAMLLLGSFMPFALLGLVQSLLVAGTYALAMGGTEGFGGFLLVLFLAALDGITLRFVLESWLSRARQVRSGVCSVLLITAIIGAAIYFRSSALPFAGKNIGVCYWPGRALEMVGLAGINSCGVCASVALVLAGLVIANRGLRRRSSTA